MGGAPRAQYAVSVNGVRCAAVLSAFPVIRIGVASLIRDEFGAGVRVVAANHTALPTLAASGGAFDLIVVHWSEELGEEHLAQLAAAALGAALVVVRAAPLRALPALAAAPRRISPDAAPAEWRSQMRAAMLEARSVSGRVAAFAAPRPLVRLRARVARDDVDGPRRLTRRQRDVFWMLCEGLPNKVIAERLELSVGTVKLHVGAVLRALQARSRLELVLNRAKLGFVARARRIDELPD